MSLARNFDLKIPSLGSSGNGFVNAFLRTSRFLGNIEMSLCIFIGSSLHACLTLFFCARNRLNFMMSELGFGVEIPTLPLIRNTLVISLSVLRGLITCSKTSLQTMFWKASSLKGKFSAQLQIRFADGQLMVAFSNSNLEMSMPQSKNGLHSTDKRLRKKPGPQPTSKMFSTMGDKMFFDNVSLTFTCS